MLGLSIVDSLTLLGSVFVAGALLYLILRPLKVDLTIKDERPSDDPAEIPEDKED